MAYKIGRIFELDKVGDPSHLPEVGVPRLAGVRSRVLLTLERRLTGQAAEGEVVDVRELSGVPRDGHDRFCLVERLLVFHLKQCLFLLAWKLSAKCKKKALNFKMKLVIP